MQETLRRKFVVFSVAAVLIVLLVLAGAINLFNYWKVEERADELLLLLAENDGDFPVEADQKEIYRLPPSMSPEVPFSTRFFFVKINTTGDYLTIETGKISAATKEKAAAYAKKVLQAGHRRGFIDDYRYLLVNKDYGMFLVFVDCSRDLQLFYYNAEASIIISGVGLLAVFLVVTLLSKRAVAPIVEGYEKQKQFITDASHELKTPLAIIQTNAEVLELDVGENPWTKSIRNQVARMNHLVGSLISLSRLEEEKNDPLKADFALSETVSAVAETFLAMAQSSDKQLHLQIQPNIFYCGNEQAIRQIVSILLDNAVKYAPEGSVIDLSLKQHGKKCILQTKNAATGLRSGNYDILFERFYRSDSSRNSQSGGYGIGLSIAKSIVAKHRGKITAESPDGQDLLVTVQL